MDPDQSKGKQSSGWSPPAWAPSAAEISASLLRFYWLFAGSLLLIWAGQNRLECLQLRATGLPRVLQGKGPVSHSRVRRTFQHSARVPPSNGIPETEERKGQTLNQGGVGSKLALPLKHSSLRVFRLILSSPKAASNSCILKGAEQP